MSCYTKPTQAVTRIEMEIGAVKGKSTHVSRHLGVAV